MKRLRSISQYYLVGALPLMTAIIYMTVILANRGWLKTATGVAGAGLLLWIIRKFRYLPRREMDYGDMKVCNLTLPTNINADIYLCPVMDRHRFLRRNVGILPPLLEQPQESFKTAIGPRLYEQEEEKFTQIAVMWEIICYRQASRVKAFLGLVTPALLLVSLVEGCYVFGWNRIYSIAPGFLNLFGPPAAALISITFLFAWSKNMSRIDYQMDDELKHYYSKTDIAAYIKRWGELLLPKGPGLVNKKSRQLELYYRNQRIERL